MENVIVFLLKASAGIALFYIVYWSFLRKETFFSANRVFLLGGLVLATALPLFPFHYEVATQLKSAPVLTLSDNSTFVEPATAASIGEQWMSWDKAIILIYLTGAAIFFMRLIIQSLAIVNLILKFKIKNKGEMKIVENDRYGLPFSFFNLVFFNPNFHKEADLTDILAHERVHIREFHWVDLLITELLTVVFWFNPFIWLVEHAIKQNHEYLADSGVISRGHSIGRYQALLVNQLMGMQIIGVTNNLNFALNKNRFNMMTKTKTPKIRAARFAWFLPALALLLVAFAEPEYPAVQTNGNSNSNLAGNQPNQKSMIASGKVVDDNGDALPGASVVVKGTALGTMTNMDGKFTLEIPEEKDATIMVSFVGLKTVKLNVKAGDSKANNQFVARMEKDFVIVDGTKLSGKPKETPPPPPPPSSSTKQTTQTPPPPPKTTDNNDEVFFVVEEMPEYPGGTEALREFVQKLAQEYVREKNLKGKAYVNFTVGANGKVKDISVEKAENEGVSKAAQAIVSKMATWKPGKQRGKAVPAYYSINIEFKIL